MVLTDKYKHTCCVCGKVEYYSRKSYINKKKINNTSCWDCSMGINQATKKCIICGLEKNKIEFYKRGRSVKSSCKSCCYKQHKDWTTRNIDKVKEYRYKDAWTLEKRCKRRGISPKELIETFENQNKKCPICCKEISLIDSAIDHNHKTDEFRGILCKLCNRALGMFGDRYGNLNRAMLYLKKFGSYEDIIKKITEKP